MTGSCRLKIALISMSDFSHLPPGGEVQLLNNFISQKIPDNIALHLVGMSFSGAYPAGRWTELNAGGTVYPFFPLCQILKSKERAKIPFRLRMVAGIRKYYRKAGLDGFDVIYVQAPETVLPLIKKGYTGKIAVHVHTDPFQTLRISRFKLFRAEFFSKLYVSTILRGMRRADKIIWSARFIWDEFDRQLPDISDEIDKKSSVVYSSYDPSLIPGETDLPLDDDTVYFITVGRLAKGKRVDFLLKVFARYIEKNADNSSGFIICGGGEELEALRAEAISLGIEDRVLFTGDLDRPALAACLSKARCFLFASASETMSLVVLESLYMGVPVVTSDVGDLKLAVRDGETGYIIKETGFNEDSYLTAIDNILDRPRENWAAACRHAASDWSPERMNRAICECLLRS